MVEEGGGGRRGTNSENLIPSISWSPRSNVTRDFPAKKPEMLISKYVGEGHLEVGR